MPITAKISVPEIVCEYEHDVGFFALVRSNRFLTCGQNTGEQKEI
jgi:hypothetical protein